jgi:flagellar motility protein MotE (MotC chaperone)
VKLSPLVIVALIFAASFGGRAMTLASDAARGLGERQAAKAETPPLLMSATPPPAKHAKAEEPAHEGEAKETHAQPAAPAVATTATSAPADRNAMLAAIRERSATLDAREAQLAERARLLEVVEKRIDEKTAELKAAKTDLEGRLSFAETAVQDDITRLAKMYESMKPQKAGEIFNTMDASFAAGFLTSMSNDGSALILANMSTDKAYAASVIIAGRNAAVNAP